MSKLQLIGPFWKNHMQFLSRVCASRGGGHQRKLLKHCVMEKSFGFLLQQMKCGLLDSDNPANGPWRKVVQPPLWACHSLTYSFTHSLPHSLISRALQLPRLQNSNTAPFWLMTSSPEQPLPTWNPKVSGSRLASFLYDPPVGGLFPSGPYGGTAAAAVWERLPYLRWATASQGLLVRRGHFASAVESQWNSASGRDVAGRESPWEG